MTHIHESLYLRCPYVRAREYLHEALATAADRMTTQTLRLTYSPPNSSIDLVKNVDVEYSKATDPMHFDEPWAVRWTPEKGGIYPSFAGLLTVRAGEDYTESIVEIEGTYKPPMGAAGAVFDAIVGRRVAGETARALIARIGAEMTGRYVLEEAAKTQASATTPEASK